MRDGLRYIIIDFPNKLRLSFNAVSCLTLLAPGYLGCIEAPGVAPEATPI